MCYTAVLFPDPPKRRGSEDIPSIPQASLKIHSSLYAYSHKALLGTATALMHVSFSDLSLEWAQVGHFLNLTVLPPIRYDDTLHLQHTMTHSTFNAR